MITAPAFDTAFVTQDPTGMRRQWEDLADREGTVFSSRPSYVMNALAALGAEPAFVGVLRSGRLVAFASMLLVRRAGCVVAKPVGTGLGVPLEFLSEDAEASDAMLDAMAGRKWMLFGDSIKADDPTLGRLYRHRGWRTRGAVRERVPVIDVPAGTTASDLRSKKSLKRLRQCRGEFERVGRPVSVEVITTAADVDRRWTDIEGLAASATAAAGRTDYLHSENGDQPLQFLREQASQGRLVIAGLVVDGRWRAHEIGLKTGSRMEGWLTHYEPSIAKLQPGHQLIQWFVENHDRFGVTVLDQGIGENAIKSAWSTSAYDIVDVAAVPAGSPLATGVVAALRAWELSPRIRTARRVAHTVLTRVSRAAGEGSSER